MSVMILTPSPNICYAWHEIMRRKLVPCTTAGHLNPLQAAFKDKLLVLLHTSVALSWNTSQSRPQAAKTRLKISNRKFFLIHWHLPALPHWVTCNLDTGSRHVCEAVND